MPALTPLILQAVKVALPPDHVLPDRFSRVVDEAPGCPRELLVLVGREQALCLGVQHVVEVIDIPHQLIRVVKVAGLKPNPLDEHRQRLAVRGSVLEQNAAENRSADRSIEVLTPQHLDAASFPQGALGGAFDRASPFVEAPT